MTYKQGQFQTWHHPVGFITHIETYLAWMPASTLLCHQKLFHEWTANYYLIWDSYLTSYTEMLWTRHF